MAKRTFLRCALIWEGTVLDDRVFPTGARVTVGESPSATFTLRGAGLGKKHCLFRPAVAGATLCLRPGLVGRIQLSGMAREAEALIDEDRTAASREGAEVRYTLNPGDEGVLVFGQVGLMFQVLDRIGRIPPASAQKILGSDPFTNKLFFGFLAVAILFFVVSRLFGESGGGFSVEQLPDRFIAFVVPDKKAARDFKQEITKIHEEERREIKKRKATASRVETSQPREAPQPDRETPVANAETEKIKKDVAKKGMLNVLDEVAKKKSPLQDILNDRGLDISLGDAVSRLNRGVAQPRYIVAQGQSNSGGISLPALVERRGSGDGLGEGGGPPAEALPATGGSSHSAGANRPLEEKKELAVVVPMKASDANVSGGELSKQEIFKVVQENKGAIKYCYEKELTRFPALRGKVEVDFIIDTDGTVKTVKTSANTLTVEATRNRVSSCLAKFIQRWRFPKPRGGKVRVIYPFTFGRTG